MAPELLGRGSRERCIQFTRCTRFNRCIAVVWLGRRIADVTTSTTSMPAAEPRCPKCGYILVGLDESRCPECGKPFDPEYVENAAGRANLLPWERPEAGSRIRRLVRTIVQASIHPGRHFAAVNNRRDRTIANAGLFIVDCVFLSLALHAFSYLFQHTGFFLNTAWKVGTSKATESTVRLIQITTSTDCFMALIQIVPMVLSALVVGWILVRFFRRRVLELRTVDLAAFLAPAIVSGGFVVAVLQAIMPLFGDAYGAWGVLAACSQPAVLLLLVWHCCRKVLLLGRAKTVGMLFACGLVEYACTAVTVIPLSQVLILMTSH